MRNSTPREEDRDCGGREGECDVTCPACGYSSDNHTEFHATFCPSWPDRCAGCEVHDDRWQCPECDHEWSIR